MICPNVESGAQVVEIGDRLACLFTDTVDIGPSTVNLRASIGIAWTDHATDADSLIAHADSAMYLSKRTGAGIVKFFPDITPVQ